MYSIDCDCGNQISVSATQAGCDVSCACGETLSVPSLSILRKSIGRDAYEAGTIDTINSLIRNGELPAGDVCAVCGLPTENTCWLHVTCERTWTRTSPLGIGWFGTIAAACFGWIAFRINSADEAPTIVGRDRNVDVPLRVRPEHAKRLSKMSSRKLRTLLRTVPIYAQLLDEFPDAVVSAIR